MKGKTNAHKSIRTSSVEFVTVNVTVPEGLTGYEVTISVNANAVVGSKNQYRRVEYIESTGGQYIDTEFIPNQNTRIVCDFALIGSVNEVLFGARASSSSKGIAFWKRSAGYFASQYNGAIINSSIANDVSRHTVDANKNIVYMDGEQIIAHSTGSFTSPVTMLLFAVNENGAVENNAKAKLYSCQIYDNGTLIRDYVPVIDEHGVAGLYDSVNDTFSPSATTTNFIAGGSVKEVIAKQTTPSETYKIPHGVDYYVSGVSKNGYIAPVIQHFTASQSSRTVDVVYRVLPMGIFIQDINGGLYTKDSWDGSQKANGIAVLTDKTSFVMSVNPVVTKKIYSTYNIKLDLQEKTQEEAMVDYDGMYNNQILADQFGYSDTYAAGYCINYKFPNGTIGYGYIGSFGQWVTVRENREEIIAIESILGLNRIAQDQLWWTSTVCDDDGTTAGAARMYGFYVNREEIEFPFPNIDGSDNDNTGRALIVFTDFN